MTAVAAVKREQGWQRLIDKFPEARLLWDAPACNGELRAYSINGCVFLVHDYQPSPDGTSNGWNIYAPVTESGNIDVTLASVYARAHGMDYDYQQEEARS